jgi:hypothetical protein
MDSTNDVLEAIGQQLKQETEPNMGEVLEEMTSSEVNRFYDGLTGAADILQEQERPVTELWDEIPKGTKEIYEDARDRAIQPG